MSGQPIGVIGAGAWGTALAQALASDGTPVLLWAREAELVAEINARTPTACSCPAPPRPAIRATGDLADLASCRAAGGRPGAVPGRVLAGLPGPRDLVLCAKGIEAGTGRLMADVAAIAAPADRQLAVLSGPTFAHEVAAGLPTAVTLACAGGEAQWARLAPALSPARRCGPTIRMT
jgi:glycerol-3-phosphate dehydrogenase (NAD(P)+)